MGSDDNYVVAVSNACVGTDNDYDAPIYVYYYWLVAGLSVWPVWPMSRSWEAVIIFNFVFFGNDILGFI